MRPSRHLLILVLLLISAGSVQAGRSRLERGPVILCYHIIGAPSQGIHAISRETFVGQMKFLKESGYRVISLTQLNEILAQRGEMPQNTVVVTVDDGWRSTLTEVLPVMRSLDFPFTAFIYPRFVGGGGSSLSWDEIRTLLKNGVDIQSHTYSHAFLTRKRQRSRSNSQYASWLWRELAGSRKTIEREIGRPVRFLAYPYGDYDARVARAAASAGYAAAVTCNEGPITSSADAYRLRRFAIDQTTTFAQFKSYVAQSGNGQPRARKPVGLRIASRKEQPKQVQVAVAASAYAIELRSPIVSREPRSDDEHGSASPVPSLIAALLPRRESDIVEETDEA